MRFDAGRLVFVAINSLPISSNLLYFTPEGQLVSQARQVRHLSRCTTALSSMAFSSSTAGQTPVQMHHDPVINGIFFKQIFEQVDPPTRTVEFITQQLVSGTGCRAKTAMDAAAQNALCFLHFG